MRHSRGSFPVALLLALILACFQVGAMADGSAAAQPAARQLPTLMYARSANVTSVKFTVNSARVSMGRTYNAAAKLSMLPKSAEDKRVTWTSSNQFVASVDANGLVCVIGEGNAKITATSVSNPDKSGSMSVIGVAVRVKSISIGSSRVADAGETFRLAATIKPENASYQSVEWRTGDESIASVDENGKVSVHASGKCVLTAITDKGKKKTSVTLRVRGGDMRTVKISAVGDVVIGGDKRFVKKADSLVGDGLTSYKRFQKLYDEKGPDYFFAGVRGILTSDDITVANYEATLTNSKNRQGTTFDFSAPPSYRTIVSNGGVDVACMANNHAYDFYSKGYNDTRSNLRAVGIRTYGIGNSTTTFKSVNGVKVGFAGFRVPASRGDIQLSISNLRKKDKCDVVVVSFHWTHSKEWTTRITGEEKSYARYAVNSGADLVVGHHKHALSGIEKYKGRIIAYDIGNFIAMIKNQLVKDGPYTDKDTVIFQQRFNVFSDGYVERVDPNFVPCMNSDTQDTLTGNPHVLGGSDAERVLQKIRARTANQHQSLVRYVSDY